MKEILLDIVSEIREYINEPFINNRLRLLEHENWLRATAALDTIEDSSNAISYYINSNLPVELGGLYLHIYGLLQALYVSQDCIVSLRKSLLNREINFSEESPDICYVRNVRDDILHATDRGKANKSYIYLTQWSLSKPYFEYYKQSLEDSAFKSAHINVADLIEKNNMEVNRYLEEIKSELEREIEMRKEEYAQKKLGDIFNGLNYTAEKLLENSHMSQWGYESTKNMLHKYKEALNERYVSWGECISDSYEIHFIDDIYDILDSEILNSSHMPGDKIDKIKKLLLDSLVHHFRNLEELAKEHDSYCTDREDNSQDDKELTINIVYPEQTEMAES